MDHGIDKYKSIQDTKKESKIPAKEPVFLIRGQDQLGPRILRQYADIHEMMGGHPAIYARIRSQAYRMEEWQAKTGVSKIAD